VDETQVLKLEGLLQKNVPGVQVVGRVVGEEPETEVEEATCTGAESVEVLKVDDVGKTVVNCDSERCDVNVAAELEVMSGHGSDVEVVMSGS